MNVRINIFLLAISAILMQSCLKIHSYSDVPTVSYNSFTLNGKAGTGTNSRYDFSLIINFTDGDGDIGLDTSQTTGKFAPDSAYYYNLFTTILENHNNVYIKADSGNFNYRIPNSIDPQGQNKTLKGTIQIDYTGVLIKSDTIRILFYLYDQALHKSNIDTTPPILLNHIL